MDTGLELIMSIKQRLVAEDEENGRKGYVLDSKDDFSDGECVNLDVWEDRYNIEWRTELDLEEFHEALGEVEGVSPEIDIVAYFAGDEGLEKVELEYQELADHEVPIKEFGNVHYSSPGFDLIWEDTAGSNTVELTQYGSDEIFEPVYSDTALSGSPESSQISSWLSQNLNEQPTVCRLMSCSDCYSSPGKLYVEVELVNSVDGNCGIDCSTTSGIKLDITNLGGSVTDVFVEAKSIHRKSVFPSSKNHNEYCFGLPVHSAQTDTVNIDIRQDNQALSFPNNTGADKIVVEIAYRNPAKLNYKEELGSLPGNSNFSGRLKLGLDLRGP